MRGPLSDNDARQLREDERSVSVAVTHATTVAISAILLTSLLLSSGQFLDQQRDRVAQQQFEEIGSDVVSHINSLDRLNASGENVTAELNPTYQRTVAGEPYTIILAEHDHTVRDDLDGPSEEVFNTTHDLRIESDVIDEPVYFPVSTKTEIEETQARGEEPRILLCEDSGDQTIALQRCP